MFLVLLRIQLFGITARIGSFKAVHSQNIVFAGLPACPTDLTVITDTASYFPGGAPTCPVTGLPYANILVNDRVDTTGHAH